MQGRLQKKKNIGKGAGGEGMGGLMWWPSVDLGPDRCQFLVLLLLLSPWRRMTDSRRLPAPGLMFIHLLIVFRPHANVQMEALLLLFQHLHLPLLVQLHNQPAITQICSLLQPI